MEATEFYCLYFLQFHLTARASKRWLKSLVIGNKPFHHTAILNTLQIRMGEKRDFQQMVACWWTVLAFTYWVNVLKSLPKTNTLGAHRQSSQLTKEIGSLTRWRNKIIFHNLMLRSKEGILQYSCCAYSPVKGWISFFRSVNNAPVTSSRTSFLLTLKDLLSALVKLSGPQGSFLPWSDQGWRISRLWEEGRHTTSCR